MPTRLLLPLVVTLALCGCSEVRDTATRAGDCAALARDVASAGLSGTPSLDEAAAAAQRLDERARDIDDAELRASVEALRDRLQGVVDEARAGDAGGVEQAVAEARDAARSTAQTCGLPADQLIG